MCPKATVVIPTFNRSTMVCEAIESVLNQSCRDFELIVVDDGSTDDTAAALERFADDQRFRYLSIDHTGCPGAVRNRGVVAGSGAFVAFLDSDDLWLPHKLATQLPLHTAEGYRLTHTAERWLRDGREVSQAHRRHKRGGMIFEPCLIKCVIGPSTAVIDRELFERSGGFREDLTIAEDYELWLRLTHTERVGYTDEVLTVKRAGHVLQLSERFGQIEIFRIRALQDLIDIGAFSGPAADAARVELARKCRIYARGAERRGRRAEAVQFNRLADRYEGVR